MEYCNICGEDSKDLVYCLSCETSFHTDCFDYNGKKCPIDGYNGWHGIKEPCVEQKKKSLFDPLFVTLLYKIRQI